MPSAPVLAALSLVAALGFLPDGVAHAAPAARRCEAAVASALVGCTAKVAALSGRC